MSIDNNTAESFAHPEDEPPQRDVLCQTAMPGHCRNAAPDAKHPRFAHSERSREFRKKYFPDAAAADWSNWHWQLQHVLRSVGELDRVVGLTPDEREAMAGASGGLPTAVTPYYASLIDPRDPADPVRRCMIPTIAELAVSQGESADPLAEETQSPIDCLIHRYPDRVLFLATEYCSAYCRYCTRSRMVGHFERKHYCHEHWEKAIAYIRQTPAVRDVVISGGDPLTLPDEALEWLLMKLRAIPHVEIVRIGTKTPAVLPMRITPSLLKILRRANPLWMSLHFTHPAELTREAAEACSRLADAGLPLGSQTVLLRGVNDDADTMRRLMTGLMRMRVRPYYLYQCDPILGSAHFRTPVSKGLEMIQALRGHVSGYAVPQFVIDAPGGGGKIPLLPEYVEEKSGDDLVLRNYQGRRYVYPDMPE